MSSEATIAPSPRLRPRIPRALSFRNISAVYIWVVLVAIFALWVPDTFLTATTLKSVLSEQAITALVAIGLVLPFAAGAIDLSIGLALGLGAMLAAILDVKTGVPVWAAVALPILACALVGVVNATLVAGLGMNAFIATIGTSSLLSAIILWISSNDYVVGLSGGLQSIAAGKIVGIAYPVFVMLAVGVVLSYMLERTPAGRYLYAAGGNADAARLAGVRVGRVTCAALVTGSAIAGVAGVLACAQLGAGSPTVGQPYLLSSLAAVFLGSTQVKPGRPNVWGTVVAVYVLATGVKGLQLAGAPVWLPEAFNGIALLIAAGVSLRRTSSRRG